MAADPATILKNAWPWLQSEYKKLDDNLLELSATLTDPTASGAERENALIASAQLLCRTIRACHQKDLFNAASEDLVALGKPQIETLQREIQEHLEKILKREESVLIVAGLDPTAARTLLQEVGRAPTHIWRPDPLHYQTLDRKVALATKDICHNFPKTNLDFGVHAFKELVKSVKEKYGIVGGLTIAAANTAVAVLVPEPITFTSFSKYIGVAYVAYSAGGA